MKSTKTLRIMGETNLYYIALGVLLTLLIIFSCKYYNDHKNDVTIHPPVIDVH
jgi:hypothetical protein